MNKYRQAFMNISIVSENSNYDDEDLIAIDLHTLRELLDKHEKLTELLNNKLEYANKVLTDSTPLLELMWSRTQRDLEELLECVRYDYF